MSHMHYNITILHLAAANFIHHVITSDHLTTQPRITLKKNSKECLRHAIACLRRHPRLSATPG